MPMTPPPTLTPARQPLESARRRLLDEAADIDRQQAEALVAVPDEDLPQLIALAHQVRLERMGPAVEVESIISAKTGGCPEDCSFCSQSARFPTRLARHAMLDVAELLRLAREARALGSTEFCIVVAVRGPDRRLLEQVCTAARPSSSPPPASTATATTSRRARASSPASAPRTASTTAAPPAGASSKPGWSCAAAASSAWARRGPTASTSPLPSASSGPAKSPATSSIPDRARRSAIVRC